MDLDFFDNVARDWDKNARRLETAETIGRAIREVLPEGLSMEGLEVGCGTGLLGFELLPIFRHLTFCDTSEGMLSEVDSKLKNRSIENGSSLSFNFVEGSYEGKFDCIFSQMLFHHVENIPAYLENLAGSLKEGGFICAADLDPEDGSFHKENSSYYHNGIERDFFKNSLTALGFSIYHESTPLVVSRNGREYPVFLIIAKKGG